MNGIPCNYPSCIAFDLIESSYWTGVIAGSCTVFIACLIVVSVGVWIYLERGDDTKK